MLNRYNQELEVEANQDELPQMSSDNGKEKNRTNPGNI